MLFLQIMQNLHKTRGLQDGTMWFANLSSRSRWGAQLLLLDGLGVALGETIGS